LEIPSGDDLNNIIKVTDMCISPSADQENLIALTSTNLIYKIKMEKDEKDIEEPSFERISSEAHFG